MVASTGCGRCIRVSLIIFNSLLWIVALGLLGVGIWMLIDPRRTYILDLVNFYEYDPLLRLASYIFIIVGSFALIMGVLGCCGAVKQIQAMLTMYGLVLLVLCLAQLVAGIMAIVFKSQISNMMPFYYYNLVHDRYGRETWITSLIDTIQFYQKCCGSNGTTDYDMSFWQIWNANRGAVVNIPISCCTQQYDAYPPDNLKPIDDRCQEFPYDKQPVDAINAVGCYSRLMDYFNDNVMLFIILGLSTNVFLVFGVVLSCCLCRSIGKRLS